MHAFLFHVQGRIAGDSTQYQIHTSGNPYNISLKAHWYMAMYLLGCYSSCCAWIALTNLYAYYFEWALNYQKMLVYVKINMFFKK